MKSRIIQNIVFKFGLYSFLQQNRKRKIKESIFFLPQVGRGAMAAIVLCDLIFVLAVVVFSYFIWKSLMTQKIQYFLPFGGPFTIDGVTGENISLAVCFVFPVLGAVFVVFCNFQKEKQQEH